MALSELTTYLSIYTTLSYNMLPASPLFLCYLPACPPAHTHHRPAPPSPASPHTYHSTHPLNHRSQLSLLHPHASPCPNTNARTKLPRRQSPAFSHQLSPMQRAASHNLVRDGEMGAYVRGRSSTERTSRLLPPVCPDLISAIQLLPSFSFISSMEVLLL